MIEICRAEPQHEHYASLAASIDIYCLYIQDHARVAMRNYYGCLRCFITLFYTNPIAERTKRNVTRYRLSRPYRITLSNDERTGVWR